MNMNYTPPKKLKLRKYSYTHSKTFYSKRLNPLILNGEKSTIKIWISDESKLDVGYVILIKKLTFYVLEKVDDYFVVELVKTTLLNEIVKFSKGKYLDKTIFILGKQYREGDDCY